jgi:hypothetical protein
MIYGLVTYAVIMTAIALIQTLRANTLTTYVNGLEAGIKHMTQTWTPPRSGGHWETGKSKS